jgi:hypothetical protein
MNAHQLIAGMGVAAMLSACGGHDPATMSDYAQDLGRHLDALEGEQVAHFSEISAMGHVDVLGPAELGHSQRMDDGIERMNGPLGAMMSCADGRRTGFDAAGFAGIMHDLRSECDEHGVLMLSAHEMDSASTEESRHYHAVGTQIGKMRRLLSPMMGTESSYSCAPCPSCEM